MNGLPANIVAELFVTCNPIDQDVQKHRIWITRNGEVITPDHESESEDIIIALGGKLSNPCSYWLAIPPFLVRGPQGDFQLAVPDMQSWNIQGHPFWTSKAIHVALTGIVGSTTYTLLNPVLALAHAKIFQRHVKKEKIESLANELDYLQTPWRRLGGFRRDRITTPEELDALFLAGVPANRIATATALDIKADHAKYALGILNGFGLPPDLLINLAYALPSMRIMNFVDRLTQESADGLPWRLSQLVDVADTIMDEDIETFLLST
jgi:hypothetical protein